MGVFRKKQPKDKIKVKNTEKYPLNNNLNENNEDKNESLSENKSAKNNPIKKVEDKLNSFISNDNPSSMDSTNEIKKIFGKVKELHEENNERRKKREEEKRIKKQQRKANQEKKLISRYNIYYGLKFKIYYPEEEIVLSQHSGLTKGLATFAFGLPGYAVTSGTKEKTKQKSTMSIVQVVDEGVILKNASQDGKDIRIPFNNIISFKEHKGHGVNRIGAYSMTLIKNQTLLLYLYEITYKERKRMGEDLYCVYEHIEKSIDDKATGSENPEEIKWLPKSQEKPIDKINTNQNSLIENIEKLGNLYERGLLTEEEFTQMKKEILQQNNNNNNNNVIEENPLNSPKFCGNCGAEILKDSRFCIQCGTQIKH